MLFYRQREDILSQLCAMRADVMLGQHIKHCGYSADIRIRLNNPEPRQPGGCKLKTAPVRPVVAARPAEYVCSEDLFY
ncbi:Uncharacterised protein [Salmonella enterica subsp. enterica serovar Bovismorbificans]|nr:Uncharacterised protein [Salmonella enterica subsp. enterica serovar Bovismorbificans]